MEIDPERLGIVVCVSFTLGVIIGVMAGVYFMSTL